MYADIYVYVYICTFIPTRFTSSVDHQGSWEVVKRVGIKVCNYWPFLILSIFFSSLYINIYIIARSDVARTDLVLSTHTEFLENYA